MFTQSREQARVSVVTVGGVVRVRGLIRLILQCMEEARKGIAAAAAATRRRQQDPLIGKTRSHHAASTPPISSSFAALWTHPS